MSINEILVAIFVFFGFIAGALIFQGNLFLGCIVGVIALAFPFAIMVHKKADHEVDENEENIQN